jgi:hypothetical protein
MAKFDVVIAACWWLFLAGNGSELGLFDFRLLTAVDSVVASI